jgi:ArsR family transcriptional regulator
VSHHLSVLVKAGFITREQRGKWAWFAVASERADFVKSVLEGTAVGVG